MRHRMGTMLCRYFKANHGVCPGRTPASQIEMAKVHTRILGIYLCWLAVGRTGRGSA
jgi:hypothetical protein